MGDAMVTFNLGVLPFHKRPCRGAWCAVDTLSTCRRRCIRIGRVGTGHYVQLRLLVVSVWARLCFLEENVLILRMSPPQMTASRRPSSGDTVRAS
jgi:hypothetical protein